MISGRPNNGWVIWCSLTIALLLSIAPMPGSAELARPLWLGLVIAFWSLTLPHRGGLASHSASAWLRTCWRARCSVRVPCH